MGKAAWVQLLVEECLLCERTKEQESEFCDIHAAARLNVEQAYVSWNAALGGNVSFKDYLERITSLNETGKFVRDVAIHMLKQKT